MKRVMYFASAVVLLAAPAVYSQAPTGQKIGLATSLQRGYAGIKANFTAAAEKMPDADYTFKVGSMPEARTYGQLIAHIAQSQFGQCSGLTGVPNPMAGKNLEQELKTKAELTKALADSFAICDKAFEAVTDAERDRAGQGRSERADARGVALRRDRARQRDRRHRLRVPADQGPRAAVDRAGGHARPRQQLGR